ncbi:MAG: MBG domain-containing protein, partial [Desulfuromonadales bacterium]
VSDVATAQYVTHGTVGGFVLSGVSDVATAQYVTHGTVGGFVLSGVSDVATAQYVTHGTVGGFVISGASTVTESRAPLTVTVTVSGNVTYGSPLSTVVSATESPYVAGSWSWSRSLSTSNLPVGTYDISATYTPTDTAYAAAWDGDWVTVIQKALSITANNMSKTYGDADPTFTYSSSGLVSGDSISGALARTGGSDVGTYSISIGTLSAGGNYSTSFTGATLTINKANQVLGTVATVWTAGAGNPAIGGREAMIGDTAVVSVSSQGASGNAVTYTSSNTGVCTVSGTTLTIVGIGSFKITAHQAGNSNYNAAADKSNPGLNTVKAPATVSSANASVTYNGSQQSAAGVTSPAGLSVSYTYNGSSTLPTNAGTYTVVGTINDTRYTGSGSWTLTINKAASVISWATPAAITYGTALTATQLNATANVPGTFSYSPPLGTVLGAGSQALSVTFYPNDSTNYSSDSDGVWLQVNAQPAVISWGTPAAITYGTALSATQLNATANVAGTFSYSPAAGTVLGAGSQALSVTFTPSDPNYSSDTDGVWLTVNKAYVAVSATMPTALNYGSAFYANNLSATISGMAVAGTWSYSRNNGGGDVAISIGTIIPAGTYIVKATFTPTDTTNLIAYYYMAVLDVSAVTAVTNWPSTLSETYIPTGQTVAASHIALKVYDPNTAADITGQFSISYNVTVNGTSYTISGSWLDIGTYAAVATLTSNNSNYASFTDTSSIVVTATAMGATFLGSNQVRITGGRAPHNNSYYIAWDSGIENASLTPIGWDGSGMVYSLVQTSGSTYWCAIAGAGFTAYDNYSHSVDVNFQTGFTPPGQSWIWTGSALTTYGRSGGLPSWLMTANVWASDGYEYKLYIQVDPYAPYGLTYYNAPGTSSGIDAAYLNSNSDVTVASGHTYYIYGIQRLSCS